jgi:hypothetical protein
MEYVGSVMEDHAKVYHRRLTQVKNTGKNVKGIINREKTSHACNHEKSLLLSGGSRFYASIDNNGIETSLFY